MKQIFRFIGLPFRIVLAVGGLLCAGIVLMFDQSEDADFKDGLHWVWYGE